MRNINNKLSNKSKLINAFAAGSCYATCLKIIPETIKEKDISKKRLGIISIIYMGILCILNAYYAFRKEEEEIEVEE